MSGRNKFRFRTAIFRLNEIPRLIKSYGLLELARKSGNLTVSAARTLTRRTAPATVKFEWPPLLPPLLTVIVPLGPNPTRRLLNSLAAQQLPEWLSVVAVGFERSLEGWRDWSLTPWANRRLKLSCLEVAGPSLKRNHGATLSDSPYLLFVDEDDELNVEALSEAIASAVRVEGAPWTVHQFPFEIWSGEFVRVRSQAGVFLHHSATIIPSQVFDYVGGYPDCEGEDVILLARLLDFPQKFHANLRGFLRYRTHNNGKTRRSSNRSEKELFAALVGLDAGTIQGDEPRSRGSLSLERFAKISARPSMTASNLWALIRIICQGKIGVPSNVQRGKMRAIQETALSKSAMAEAWKAERKLLLNFLLDAIQHPKLIEVWNDHRVASTHWGIINAVRRFGVSRRKPYPPSYIKLKVINPGPMTPALLVHYLAALKVYQSIRLVDGEAACGREAESLERVWVSTSNTNFASQLLRIGQQSRADERKLAGYTSAAILRELAANPDDKMFRLYGTGPSATNVSDLSPGVGGIGVACSSWVKRPDLLIKLKISVVAAGDPVFHAGPSKYATKFRHDLSNWLRMNENHLFVTVTRDAHIFREYMPEEIRQQILALDIRPSLLASEKTKLKTMHLGAVPPYSNVLPLLMIPAAIIGSAERIHLLGFDGDHLHNREYFWPHSATVQYEELLATVGEMHPEIFNLDYSDYRATVSAQISDVLGLVRAIGCDVSTEVPSSHYSLASTARVERLHVFA